MLQRALGVALPDGRRPASACQHVPRLLSRACRQAAPGRLVRLWILALACLSIGGLALGQRKADVQLIEVKARRIDAGQIVVDGRVRCGDKPIRKLAMIFDFMSDTGEPLTSLKAEIEDDVLSRGEESSFHAVSQNPPGAIRYKLRAVDFSGKPLRLSESGPFTVE